MSPEEQRRAAIRNIHHSLTNARKPQPYNPTNYGYCGGMINMAFFLRVIDFDEAARLGGLLENALKLSANQWLAQQEATHAA